MASWVGRERFGLAGQAGLVRRVGGIGCVERRGGAKRRGWEPKLGLPFARYLSGRSATGVIMGLVFVAVGVFGIEFGMGFGEGRFGEGGEEFLEGHACESDFGVGQGSVGIIVGVGFGFGLGFCGFAEFEQLFCDAHFCHEFGDFWSWTVEEAAIFFELIEFFGSHAAAAVGEQLFLDIRAFGPYPEFLFFFVGGVGLAEGEPVALDLEVVVGEGGAAEARDIGGELAEGVPFALGVGF